MAPREAPQSPERAVRRAPASRARPAAVPATSARVKRTLTKDGAQVPVKAAGPDKLAEGLEALSLGGAAGKERAEAAVKSLKARSAGPSTKAPSVTRGTGLKNVADAGNDAEKTLTEGVKRLSVAGAPAKRIPATGLVRKPMAHSATPANRPSPSAKAPRGRILTSAPSVTPAEQASGAMRTINASLATLSEIKATGWRADSSTPEASGSSPRSKAASTATSSKPHETTRQKAQKVAKEVGEALATLRTLAKDINAGFRNKAPEIEKANLAVTRSLTEMSMFPEALHLLHVGHPYVLALYDAQINDDARAPLQLPNDSVPSSSWAAYSRVLRFPPPPSPSVDFQTKVAPIILLAFVQGFTAFVKAAPACSTGNGPNAALSKGKSVASAAAPIDPWRLRAKACAEALAGTSSAPHWLGQEQFVGTSEGQKKASQAVHTVYSIVMKACSSWENQIDSKMLLHVRRNAIASVVSHHAREASDKLDGCFDQARRSLILYAQARGSDATPQNVDVALEGRTFLDAVLVSLRSVELEPNGVVGSLNGKGWISLCELAIAFARRVDDIDTISLVNSLLGAPNAVELTQDDVTLSPAQKTAALDAEISRLAARLAGATASLEKHLKSRQANDVAQVVTALEQAPLWIRSLDHLRTQTSQASGSEVPAHTAQRSKVASALDRLRRLCVKTLRGETGETSGKGKEREVDAERPPKSILDQCRIVARSLAAVREDRVEVSTVPGIVDTLLCLADDVFNVAEPSSQDASLADLDRARQLVETCSAADDSRLHLVRCVSSAYYNIGVALFNADKPAAAVRFLYPACAFPTALFHLDSLAPEPPVLDGRDALEGLTDLRRQLVRRWELMALCYLKLDKRKAHSAYISALLAHPPVDVSAVAQACGRLPLPEATSELSNFVKTVQRISRLAVFDLLLSPEECSLQSALDSASAPANAVGMALELQAASLAPHVRKEGCAATIGRIFEQLLDVYTSQRYPLRRARVLLRLLEHRLGSDGENPERWATEVVELAGAASYSEDDGLRPYVAQYCATADAMLALHCQQQGRPDVLVTKARTAVQHLRQLDGALLSPSRSGAQRRRRPSEVTFSPIANKARSLSGSKGAAAASPARTPPKIAKAPTRGRAVLTASRGAAAKTARTKQILTTPPSKTFSPAASLRASTTSVHAPSAPLPVFDDWATFSSQLSLLADVLGGHGQVALRIALLQIIIRFANRSESLSSSVARPVSIAAAASLALEYVRIGKTDRAKAVLRDAESKVQMFGDDGSAAWKDATASLALCQALQLATVGQIDEAHRIYADVRAAVADAEAEATPSSSVDRVLQRTRLLAMSAQAACAFSTIQLAAGDLRGALVATHQALRLATRASSNLGRIAAHPIAQAKEAGDDEPHFAARDTPNSPAPLPEVPAVPPPTLLSVGTQALGGVRWQVGGILVDVLRRIVGLYLLRGSPRQAEGYLHQLNELARQVGAPRPLSRGLSLQAELALLSGDDTRAFETLQQVLALLDAEPSAEGAEAGRLFSDLYWRQGRLDDAYGFCTTTSKTLIRFDRVFAGPEEPSLTPHKSPRPSLASTHPSPPRSAGQNVLPIVRAHIARLKARIARGMTKSDDFELELGRLSRSSLTPMDEALQSALLATFRLDDVRQRLRQDPLLGSLSEAVVALPFSVPFAGRAIGRVDHGSIVGDSIALLRSAMSTMRNSASAHQVREAMYTFAELRSLQYLLGKPSSSAPAEVAAALDFGASLTIARELLEAASVKMLPQALPDDVAWPQRQMTPPATNHPTKAYWRDVESRHCLAAAAPTEYRPLTGLPAAWGVVSLHLALDESSLFLVRHGTATPLVVRLPLDRNGRREGEEDLFSYQVAATELQTIIAATNDGAKRAKFVSGHNAKALWWAERKELDERMKDLLETIENSWLGSCKGLLRRRPPQSETTAVKSKLEQLFLRHLISPQDRSTNRLRVDDSVVSAFAALPKECSDEDLEDLLHFAMDMLQLSGTSVICDEVDVDQVVCDLREAQSVIAARSPSDEHLFLILDKRLQAFPWEMVPVLAGCSVSRIPNLGFLRDRLTLPASWSAGSGMCDDGRLTVDARKTSYILNPSGDLTNTQAQFEDWLEANHGKGWQGVKGRAPSSEEVRHDLSSSDLLLYFGHGGAEQYIRSQSIRQLQRCAVTMLWGCSSGMLRDMGDFDPFGTPTTYMLGGCPTLLANLWDVTDKDIDRLAKDVFRRTGLDGSLAEGVAPSTLSQALADARSTCNLRYLNGAAPVIYGLPCSFTWS